MPNATLLFGGSIILSCSGDHLLSRLGLRLIVFSLVKAKFGLELGPHVKLLLDKDEEECEPGEYDGQAPHVFQGFRINADNLGLDGLGERVDQVGANGLVCLTVAELSCHILVRDTVGQFVEVVVEDGSGLG